MGHEVTAQYRQAEARYAISGNTFYRVATLLNYTGAQQNRPPLHVIVLNTPGLQRSFADDVCRSLANAQPQQPPPDPLFPEKTCRALWVDHLV